MSQFKINYNRLLVLLLPSFLRSPALAALLKSATQGISSLYSNFITNRNNNLIRLNHNSQVCYLQKILNDNYDPTSRKILIDDFSAYGTLSYIYKESYIGKHMIIYRQSSDEWESTPILCSEAALATGVTTFTIKLAQTGDVVDNIIATLGPDQELNSLYRKFCSLVDKYKLAGKKYKIVKYTPKN